MIYPKLRKPGQLIHTVKLYALSAPNDPFGRYTVKEQCRYIETTFKGNWNTLWSQKEIFDPDIGDWVCPVTFKFEDPDEALMFAMKYSSMTQTPQKQEWQVT